jgi:hypothetical protein
MLIPRIQRTDQAELVLVELLRGVTPEPVSLKVCVTRLKTGFASNS